MPSPSVVLYPSHETIPFFFASGASAPSECGLEVRNEVIGGHCLATGRRRLQAWERPSQALTFVALDVLAVDDERLGVVVRE